MSSRRPAAPRGPAARPATTAKRAAAQTPGRGHAGARTGRPAPGESRTGSKVDSAAAAGSTARPGTPARPATAGKTAPAARPGRTSKPGGPTAETGTAKPGSAARAGSSARPGGSARPAGAGRSGARSSGGRAGQARTGAHPLARQRRAVSFGMPGRDGEPRPTVSLRALGLFLVLLVAFAVLAPTMRYAVTQQEQLRSLNARVSEAEGRNADLERQLARWQDPEYVQAQARDRLGYVMPGEMPYVVVDPETVTGGQSLAEAEAEERAAARAAATPWYVRTWDSVQVAGESVTGGEDPSGLTVPTEVPTP